MKKLYQTHSQIIHTASKCALHVTNILNKATTKHAFPQLSMFHFP